MFSILEKRGLKRKSIPLYSARPYFERTKLCDMAGWEYATQMGARLTATVYGYPDEVVHFVTASAPRGNSRATAEFLTCIAALPYDGAQLEVARNWVRKTFFRRRRRQR
jgi:hypothetical protein